MSSPKVEQRKENRRGERRILGHWALAICWLFGFGYWCPAQRTTIVADPGSWSFDVNLTQADRPSAALLAGGVFKMSMSSIGLDETTQSIAPNSNKAGLDGSANHPVISPLDFNWQLAELTVTGQTNIGSTGLLNLSAAGVTNLGTISWKIDSTRLAVGQATIPTGNRVEIRFDRIDLAKSALTKPMSTASEDADRFANWIVKPDSMPTFASSGMTGSVPPDDPISMSSSYSLGLGQVETPAIPLPINLVSNGHIATLAGP